MRGLDGIIVLPVFSLFVVLGGTGGACIIL